MRADIQQYLRRELIQTFDWSFWFLVFSALTCIKEMRLSLVRASGLTWLELSLDGDPMTIVLPSSV